MPKLKDIKKVLVIGSGPIIIGQAAEFDYAGTQACRALKEEGLEVVLINSNPATIMTDVHVADRVYVEPISDEFIEKIIKRERPDSLLATLGWSEHGYEIGRARHFGQVQCSSAGHSDQRNQTWRRPRNVQGNYGENPSADS